MAEYLSPGVYVEEFESGPRPMIGVSTSVTGFLGITARGPTEGLPQLITSQADFQRKYGGYLSETEFQNYRFLPHAIDHFFANGGSRCFIMRIFPQDADKASVQKTSVQEVSVQKTSVQEASTQNEANINGNIIAASNNVERVTYSLASGATKPNAVLIKKRSSQSWDISYKNKSQNCFEIGKNIGTFVAEKDWLMKIEKDENDCSVYGFIASISKDKENNKIKITFADENNKNFDFFKDTSLVNVYCHDSNIELEVNYTDTNSSKTMLLTKAVLQETILLEGITLNIPDSIKNKLLKITDENKDPLCIISGTEEAKSEYSVEEKADPGRQDIENKLKEAEKCRDKSKETAKKAQEQVTNASASNATQTSKQECLKTAKLLKNTAETCLNDAKKHQKELNEMTKVDEKAKTAMQGYIKEIEKALSDINAAIDKIEKLLPPPPSPPPRPAENIPGEFAGNVNIKISAKYGGTWGNNIKVTFKPTVLPRAKTVVIKEQPDLKNRFQVKSSAQFQIGDVVTVTKKNAAKTNKYYVISESANNLLTLFTSEDSPNIVIEPDDTIATYEFDINVTCDDVSEIYKNLSLCQDSPNFIDTIILNNSDIIEVETDKDSEDTPLDLLKKYAGDFTNGPLFWMTGDKNTNTGFTVKLSGGTNGSISDINTYFLGSDNGPGKRTGIKAFLDNDIVSMLCAPGVTDSVIQQELVIQCETLKNRFAILDMPPGKNDFAALLEHREILDSDYAAMYHPWLKMYDPLAKKTNIMPPSGAVAGIYARSDIQRGVHKAPANEVVKGAAGLDCVYNKGEQDCLNPRGINLIRPIPGQGIRVWGARTCSSNTLWKYINVRRLFIYLEESIKANTNWIVFEPNDEILWLRVKRTIEVFLHTVWQSGALFGASPEEAYFVDIGRSTMTQDDIDNGRLICIIGVAPVKPAEFVIFRLTQKTAEG